MIGTEEQNEFMKEIEKLKKRITKKNREIRELKMVNLFLGSLFDGIGKEIMVIDNNLDINDVNKAFLRRYGLKKRSVLGKKCHEIKQLYSAPCNQEDSLCPVERARDTGDRVEMTHTHKDKKGETKEFIIIIYL